MEEITNVKELPVLPLRGLVIFPEMILHFDVGRKRSKAAINAAMNKEQEIFITAQKDPSVNTPALSDIYKIGTVCKITQIVNTKDDIIRVTIQGKSRGLISDVTSDSPNNFAKIAEVPKSEPKNTVRESALVRATKSIFDKYIELSPNFSPEYIYKVSMCSDPSEIADYIAGNIILDFANKQMILEELDTEKRLELLIEVLSDELNIIEVETDIVEKARAKIEQSQREYLLREQLSVIQEELGEDDNPVSEAEQYAEKIQQLNLPKDISEPLLKE